MLKVSDSVRRILLGDDVALQSLESGILNFSAYAAKIILEVENLTFKPVKKGTVVVALTRLAQEIGGLAPLKPRVILDDLSIRSPLCDITYPKTPANRAKLAELPKIVPIGENAFLATTIGLSEITIIAPQSSLDRILAHFVDSPKAVLKDLVGITVRFDEKYLQIPNVLYTLQAALAVQRINCLEVISTYTELSFVIEAKDLETATKALRRFFE